VTPEKRERPGVGTEAFEDQAWRRSTDSVAADPVIDGVFVAVVETGNGHYRRRVYFSLQSATAAVQRAKKAGVAARIVLCELKSLGGVA
jgi:hypothetical protein